MNRRGFLGMLVGGVAAAAAVRTFPFRVFSFPKEIKVAADSGLFFETWDEWNKLAIYTNGLGNLGHPSALDVYLAEQRKAFPYADLRYLRYVSVDGGTLPLGRSVCTSVDPITKVITWEPA